MNEEFSLTIVSSCINNIAKFSFVEQVNLYSLSLYESRNSPVNLQQKWHKQKQVTENMSILFLSDSFLGIIMLATKQSHLVKYTPLVLYTQIISSCKRPFISKQKPCNNSGIMTQSATSQFPSSSRSQLEKLELRLDIILCESYASLMPMLITNIISLLYLCFSSFHLDK